MTLKLNLNIIHRANFAKYCIPSFCEMSNISGLDLLLFIHHVGCFTLNYILKDIVGHVHVLRKHRHEVVTFLFSGPEIREWKVGIFGLEKKVKYLQSNLQNNSNHNLVTGWGEAGTWLHVDVRVDKTLHSYKLTLTPSLPLERTRTK